MVIENFSETLMYVFPPELVGRTEFLITILQTLGIFVILYIIFSIINAIYLRKRNNEIKKINENLEDIKNLLGKK